MMPAFALLKAQQLVPREPLVPVRAPRVNGKRGRKAEPATNGKAELNGKAVSAVRAASATAEPVRAASATAEPAVRARPRSVVRRVLGSRSLVWSLVLLVSSAAVGLGLMVRQESRRADEAATALRSAEGRVTAAEQRAGSASAVTLELEQRLADLKARLETVRASKVRTVIEKKKVTETVKVTKWIPNGKNVTVEITGFEGLVAIHDVQLTKAYGYSDLVGIAVNESGRTISYAQVGCTFLDAEGRVLANGFDNKQGWQAGQTWGFTCSAQVAATGGILRVDEMS